MKINEIKYARPENGRGLTLQTKRSARNTLARLQPGGGHVTVDIIDPNGALCHAQIAMAEDGRIFAPKQAHDPRSVMRPLKRKVFLDSLTLAFTTQADALARTRHCWGD